VESPTIDEVLPHKKDIKERTFRQRLYGMMADLATIEADRLERGEDGAVYAREIMVILNKWTTDPEVDDNTDITEAGEDALKLMEGLSWLLFDEDEIASSVHMHMEHLEALLRPLSPDRPEDRVDLLVHELEHDLENAGLGVAYLTAFLDGDLRLAHEIIDAEGCSLVHVLTSWFVHYMVSRETLPESDDGDDITLLKTAISRRAIENARLGAMTQEEKRAMIEEQVERFRHLFDQDDE
jgi:hypothetical protein